MKKILSFVILMAAMAIVSISCSKDEKDPVEVAKNLANIDWEGYLTEQRRTNGQWESNDQRNYVVVRFNGSGASPQYGTGYQVEYSDSYKNDQTGFSNLKWKINGKRLEIEYETVGWNPVYIDYNDAIIEDKIFRGCMYDYKNEHYRFIIEWNKCGNFDWSKVKKN